MSAPRILSVQPMKGKKLLVKFIGGTEKVYDCSPLLRLEVFQLLNNEAFFKAVKVDSGGYGISWNDAVDLSEYELWTKGIDVVTTQAPVKPEPNTA